MKKIKAWCLNTNGAATAWEVMNEACSEEVPIIAMQEICMKKEEAEAFATRAFSLGYVTYFGHGEQSPKDGKMRGGVCLMVDKRLRSREYSTICGKGGQCIMVYVQDMVMASCYLAHHEERMHHCEKIVENIQAIGGRTAWIIGGDFNDEPHQNPLLTTLETLAARAVTVEDAEERMPTRFKGSRCIDYWITNKKVGITEPCLLEESYSDHRLLQITIDEELSMGNTVVTQKTVHYAVPEDYGTTKWKETFRDEWAKLIKPKCPTQPTQRRLDDYWMEICTILETVCRKCYRTALAETKDIEKEAVNIPKGKGKGRVASFEDLPKRSLHPDDKEVAFRIRRQRKTCGRLKEIVRLEALESNDALSRERCSDHHERSRFNEKKDKRSKTKEELWEKLRKAQQIKKGESAYRALLRLTEDLDKDRKNVRDERIKKWKAKMQNCSKSAYKWLRGKMPEIPVNIYSATVKRVPGGTGDVSENLEQAMHVLKEHWKTVWERESPDETESWRRIDEALGERVLPQAWNGLEGEELAKAAKKMSGGSPGVDGWHGDELANFPKEVWDDLSVLFGLCEDSGLTPSVWKEARQVHIPKPGKKKREDGATDAGNLRPICVFSCFWRLWGGCRLRSQDTKSWVEGWMPAEAYGGKAGVEVMSAAVPLMEAVEKGEYLASLDYSLAFDHAEPKMVTEILRRLGMPPQVVKMIMGVWSDQRRFLQYAGQTDKIPAKVSKSMPQGDAMSMLGMAALLLPPMKEAKEKWPEATQVVFVDDRSWTTKTARERAEIQKHWENWSCLLGLKENLGKHQFFNKRVEGRRKLAEAGVQPMTITVKPLILGIQMQAAEKRKISDREMARVKDTVQTIQRCGLLPVRRVVKLKYICTAGISKCCWGWACRPPALSDLKPVGASVRQAVQDVKMSSPHLRAIFKGHRADAVFATGEEQFMAAHRRSLKVSDRWPAEWRAKTGWSGAINKWMTRCGWKTIGPWTWKNGSLEVSLDKIMAQYEPTKKVLGHKLREGWRRCNFMKWMNSDRRDRKAATGI